MVRRNKRIGADIPMKAFIQRVCAFSRKIKMDDADRRCLSIEKEYKSIGLKERLGMIRRICNGVFLTVLLCLLAFRVAAASQGSIRVVTRGGTVALYRVGNFEDTHFRLLEAYGGGEVSFDESLSPELAAKLVQYARSGYVKAADLNGIVSFSGKEAGLYLVVQRSAPPGYEPFAPFLVSLPWDGNQWDVRAEPKLEGAQPQTGDRANPEQWFAVMCLSAAGLVWCTCRGWEEIRKV